jgi:hypothetical protein
LTGEEFIANVFAREQAPLEIAKSAPDNAIRGGTYEVGPLAEHGG